jgi:hypothetical protein
VSISAKPSPLRVVLMLVVVVVAVGGVSLLATGAGRTTPVNHAVLPVARTPAPLSCEPDQLALAGPLNACASIDSATRSCDATAVGVLAIFNLTSSAHHYKLAINLTDFVGQRLYALDETTSTVAFRDDNGYEWRSVAGSLTVVSPEGRSGTINATLESSSSVIPLRVVGRWSCGGA